MQICQEHNNIESRLLQIQQLVGSQHMAQMHLAAGLVSNIGPGAPRLLQQPFEFIHCNYLFSITNHQLKLIQRKFTTPKEE
ncbi:Uncharacterised protein [uncultured archaeon]|nr:Uncharacterised protein [uncultured archaeon]